MTEPAFQISDKLDDGAILVVRGNSYAEFVNNLGQVTEDHEFTNGINSFLTTVRGAKPATPQQAVAQVQQNLGAQPIPQQQWNAQQPPAAWQQPQQQFAQQPSGQNMFACEHGQRIERSGNNAKGGWKAYFCPQKAPGCKPMGADGKLWK